MKSEERRDWNNVVRIMMMLDSEIYIYILTSFAACHDNDIANDAKRLLLVCRRLV